MTSRPSRFSIAWPALLATVVLLVALLGGYAWMESRRLQQHLRRELEDRGAALIGVLEASSRNAIAGQALLEEQLAQRLLDNARFVDSFVARSPRAAELIARVVRENKLARVEILDPAGNPLTVPPPGSPASEMAQGRGFGPGHVGGGRGEQVGPRGMMRGWMRRQAEEGATEERPADPRPRGMPFMWGQRWGMRGNPDVLFPALPKTATVRRFWEGSEFGVAVPAQTFDGLIAVHASAESLLEFRKAVGVQRLIEDLARQGGVAGVDLLDGGLSVLASSDPGHVGRQAAEPFLREALATGRQQARSVTEGGRAVYEIVRPFTIEKDRPGLVRLALGTEGAVAAAAQAERSILWYSLALLGVGVAGAGTIFWLQARHLAERRALEAAVMREQRLSAMGNLAAGVAHEIRNPLNAISVGLQRLRLEFAPAAAEQAEEYGGFTRLMQGEVARLNGIVDRFLTLARPLRLALTDEPVDGLLQEVLALLGSQAASQHVEVRQGLEAGVRVRMDRQQLTQAFMNLLLNALQAMPDGGVLRAETRRARMPGGRDGVEVRITDTGPGVAAEHRERIFEPYFTTKESGTGLGLALTRKIVHEHAGEIHLDTPGRGATFVVTLPLVPPSSGAEGRP